MGVDADIDTEGQVAVYKMKAFQWKAALVLGVIPFVLHFTSTSTENGHTVTLDFVALPAGAVGALLGLWALGKALGAPQPIKVQQIGLAALGLALGALHCVRGLGLF